MPAPLLDLVYGADPRQRLDLFLPDKPAPRLFVFVHGGGWRGGDKAQYRALGELLCGFGYAVALPNHRLAPGYRHPAAIADVAAAVNWLRRYSGESGIRTDGMIFAGHSSGAHLAALLALHPRWQAAAGNPSGAVAAVVCISGIYDLLAAPDAAAYLEPVFGGDPDPDGAWRDASPLQHVASGAPPFFLAHAEFDYPGADAQARAMAAALERAGAAAQCISIPGRDHVSILAGVRSLFDPLALSLAMFLRAAV